MTDKVMESCERRNFTATGTIVADNAKFLSGVFVSQASSTPTLKLADDAGNIANTFTPAAGTFYKLPARIQGPLVVTISGTVDCTVFYGS